VALLDFNKWNNLNESVAFDPSGNYPDKTFGYIVGAIDSGKANLGGTGGDWGGSMQRALWFAKIADEWGTANGKEKSLVSSQKRSREMTASGNMSDHFKGNENAYAVDISAKGEEGNALLAYIMNKFGHPEYKGGSWFNVTIDGYRYQVGWQVKDHYDHIHIGVKKTLGEKIKSAVSSVKETFGSKLLKNPKVTSWLNKNVPELAGSITAQELDNIVTSDPKAFGWFKQIFKLNDLGDPVDSTDSTSSNTGLGKKIKSKFTGDKAKNIDILVDEMAAQGITNKYAVVGILSTIGKESGFIPKNEIGYGNTSNSRIRKIFGSRVSKLSDDQLDALKKNDAAFFDKVYGAEATSALGWKTGNTAPGDGWKYRGRGFNQITFKHSYEKYNDVIRKSFPEMDIVSNPDLLNDVRIAAKAAVAFLKNNLKGMGIDATDPNVFSSKKEAIDKVVQANHGGGSVAGSEGLAKAHDISTNFDVS
jgi:predicted chitinase